MTINNDGVESEGLQPLLVSLHVVPEGGGVALTQPVDIDDGAQVVELVVPGEV